MSAIESVNTVDEYPNDSSVEAWNNRERLIVRNHANRPERVILEIGGKKYIFIVDHLLKAIKNAQNAHSY